jgi:hypothetical protein
MHQTPGKLCAYTADAKPGRPPFPVSPLPRHTAPWVTTWAPTENDEADLVTGERNQGQDGVRSRDLPVLGAVVTYYS